MNSFWVQSSKFAIPFMFWLIASLIIGGRFQYFLAAQVVWIVAFTLGKSTRVPLDPEAGPHTPMIRLSYRDYNQRAQEKSHTNIPDDYFDRTDKHWTEKISLLMESERATSHTVQPSLAILKMAFVCIPFGLFLFFPDVKAYVGRDVEGSPTGQLLAWQIVAGLLLGSLSGSACGQFYRWFRGKLESKAM
jgi:hypothetical protein